ncbi:gamma-butyrobetaine hydroxylase-like domain-containing protein [Bremerella sp. T1]|uniref:gamma-butyrobetaine hydroxylase-like domain-containing protein n=1 Tax=Bremerella sp. TYQ1 TaxID=3119568 RepID=UPI001CC9ADE9|nr:DUF971 domain-containing protein [Bremerella volcania]UBM38590.1 DUF971 domain-containing protein [Bremerella volcania]
MTPQPTALALLPDGRLRIDWSDESSRVYKPRDLRDASPDALTREKKSHASEKPTNELTILSPEELAPITIKGMNPVGHYAYQIVFSDGHDSGIYRYEYLYELGQPYEA